MTQAIVDLQRQVGEGRDRVLAVRGRVDDAVAVIVVPCAPSLSGRINPRFYVARGLELPSLRGRCKRERPVVVGVA
jgi:hypothetical protein